MSGISAQGVINEDRLENCNYIAQAAIGTQIIDVFVVEIGSHSVSTGKVRSQNRENISL